MKNEHRNKCHISRKFHDYIRLIVAVVVEVSAFRGVRLPAVSPVTRPQFKGRIRVIRERLRTAAPITRFPKPYADPLYGRADL